MNTSLHLGFTGQCDEAFTFYETVFHTPRISTMKWSDAPSGACPEGAEGLVMHTAIKLGTITLMGADAPPGRGKPICGVDISLDTPDEGEVHRLFAELSAGGFVSMPLGPTFWTPLFGMCTDKFGVSWMLSVPGPQPAAAN
jgi:PhnB protein